MYPYINFNIRVDSPTQQAITQALDEQGGNFGFASSRNGFNLTTLALGESGGSFGMLPLGANALQTRTNDPFPTWQPGFGLPTWSGGAAGRSAYARPGFSVNDYFNFLSSQPDPFNPTGGAINVIPALDPGIGAAPLGRAPNLPPPETAALPFRLVAAEADNNGDPTAGGVDGSLTKGELTKQIALYRQQRSALAQLATGIDPTRRRELEVLASELDKKTFIAERMALSFDAIDKALTGTADGKVTAAEVNAQAAAERTALTGNTTPEAPAIRIGEPVSSATALAQRLDALRILQERAALGGAPEDVFSVNGVVARDGLNLTPLDSIVSAMHRQGIVSGGNGGFPLPTDPLTRLAIRQFSLSVAPNGGFPLPTDPLTRLAMRDFTGNIPRA